MSANPIVGYYVGTPRGRRDFQRLRDARLYFEMHEDAEVLGRWRERTAFAAQPMRTLKSRHGEVMEDRRR